MNNILSKIFKIISKISLCPSLRISLIGITEAIYNIITLLDRRRSLKKFTNKYCTKSKDQSKRKLAVVTGGSNGIGKELVKILIEMGYKVHIFARDTSSMEILKRMYGPDCIEYTSLDLSNPKEIQKKVIALVKKYISMNKTETKFIDLLINNAGVYQKDLIFKYGIEYNFLVNHVGHYILTRELLPYISQRIVNVSSSALYSVNDAIYFKKISSFQEKDMEKYFKSSCDLLMTKYSMSKLANALFSLYLKNIVDKDVSVVSVHPGMIASGLFDNVIYKIFVKIIQNIFPFFLFSKKEGAMSIAKAALTVNISENKCEGDFFMRGEKGFLPDYVNFNNSERLIEYTDCICKALSIKFDHL